MSTLKQRLPGLKSKYRGPAFRAVEAILKGDPVLAAQVKTWRSREGNDDDMQVPAWDQMPMVALSPMPLPNTTADEQNNKINLEIAVELFVPGTCFEDIDGLWSAIEDAIVPSNPFRDGTVQGFLCDVFGQGYGVVNLRARSPGFYGVKLRDNPNQNDAPNTQSGTGSLTCFFRRPA